MNKKHQENIERFKNYLYIKISYSKQNIIGFSFEPPGYNNAITSVLHLLLCICADINGHITRWFILQWQIVHNPV